MAQDATATDKRGLLGDFTVGQRVAEDEIDALASYFVETDQWRRMYAGDIDVVYGPKGAGKSAIYFILSDRSTDLFDRAVLLQPAENPRGAPVFSDIAVDPPTEAPEFLGLWKLYFLSLIARVFLDFGIKNEAASYLVDRLAEAGIAPEASSPLKSILGSVRQYLKTIRSVEAGIAVDPTTGAPSISGKITLGEPSATQKATGYVSVDYLLQTADDALTAAGSELWIVLDRLDVAFADTPDLESNALRALFQAYLDLVPLNQLSLKIFLRSDIWATIAEEGFREASHITRQLTITWDRASLMKLVIQRLLRNRQLLEYYAVDPDQVLASRETQEEFFYRVFPDQVDSGPNKPSTFDWLLGRTADGTGKTAPRELIHLLSAARDEQLRKLENGDAEPPESQLIGRQALKDALPVVSKTRLEQTIYAEYPRLKPYIEGLEREKTNQTIQSLSAIWKTNEETARRVADDLVRIGFFEQRGSKADPSFWVPFLYRPALKLVQGTAES